MTGKRNVAGVLVDPVDYQAAVARVLAAAHRREPLAVAALAVHGVMSGALDPTHRRRLNQLDLVLPDGQPVRWALNLLHGAALPDRVYGPELTLRLCQAAADEGLPVFFYGSTPAVLRRLQDNLCQRFPALQVAGSRPSAFGKLSASQRDQVVRQVRDSGAAMTFVGLGCPRQEVWVFEQRGALSMPLLAVGAAFDFHAGTLEQAPAVLQRAGLEWLFRLTREPGRLWRRYALLNPLYLALLGMQAAGLKTLDPDAGVAPPGPVRYG